MTDTENGGTYDDALAYAANMPKCCGGTSPHLVTITSLAENSFIVNEFGSSLGYDLAFIGLDDRDTSGVHEWVTKEAATTFRQSLIDGVSAGLCVVIDEIGDWPAVTCSPNAGILAVFEYDCAG